MDSADKVQIRPSPIKFLRLRFGLAATQVVLGVILAIVADRPISALVGLSLAALAVVQMVAMHFQWKAGRAHAPGGS